jgi:hypothetical protein
MVYGGGGSSVEDGAFWGRGGNDGNWGKDLRGWEFLNWDFLIWDEGFKRWVLKGREGGPVFFVEALMMEGFLGKFEEGVGEWGMRQGSIAFLDCEEGVVDVVWGSTWEDEVRGIRWGEEGDVGVGVLDHLVGGSGVLFIKSVEFGPRGGGGSGGGH